MDHERNRSSGVSGEHSVPYSLSPPPLPPRSPLARVRRLDDAGLTIAHPSLTPTMQLNFKHSDAPINYRYGHQASQEKQKQNKTKWKYGYKDMIRACVLLWNAMKKEEQDGKRRKRSVQLGSSRINGREQRSSLPVWRVAHQMLAVVAPPRLDPDPIEMSYLLNSSVQSERFKSLKSEIFQM